MKRIHILITLVVAFGALIVSAQVQGKGGTRMTEKKDPKEVVQAIFAAFNRHDAEGIASYYAENTFVDSPDFPAPKRSPKEVAENYRKILRVNAGH